MENDNEEVYHQVGEYWTHFQEDMDNITRILTDSGYRVCKTMTGNMIIMSSGDYDDDIFDDDDDDDDNGNIFRFPREY